MAALVGGASASAAAAADQQPANPVTPSVEAIQQARADAEGVTTQAAMRQAVEAAGSAEDVLQHSIETVGPDGEITQAEHQTLQTETDAAQAQVAGARETVTQAGSAASSQDRMALTTADTELVRTSDVLAQFEALLADSCIPSCLIGGLADVPESTEDGWRHDTAITPDEADMAGDDGNTDSTDLAVANTVQLRSDRIVLGPDDRILRTIAADSASDLITLGGGGTGANGSCTHNGGPSGFRAFEPTRITKNLKQYYLYFVYQAYKYNRARRVYPTNGSAYNTKQFAYCSAGGAVARGGNHLTRVFTAQIAHVERPIMLNWDWHSGTTNAATSSVSINGSRGGVGISGSTSVKAQDTFDGQLGKYSPAPGYMDPFSQNQVTAYWVSPKAFRWHGSTAWEGNTANATYELRQSAANPNFSADAKVRWHCGYAYGIGCA